MIALLFFVLAMHFINNAHDEATPLHHFESIKELR